MSYISKISKLKCLIFLTLTIMISAGLSASSDKKEKFAVPPGAKAGDLTLEPGTYKIKKGIFKSVEYAADLGMLVVPVGYHALMGTAGRGMVIPLKTSWHAFLGSGENGGTAKEPYHLITVGGEGGAYKAVASSDWVGGQKDAARFAAIASGEPLSHRQSGRYWQRRAAEDFLSDPARYLRNYVTKLGLFWGQSEPPANIDFRFAPFKKGTWKSYTTLDGLPHHWLEAIHRTPDGVLWFGTSGGVSRYDGKEFVNFTTKNGLTTTNWVYAIQDGPDRMLWFGT